MESVLANNGWCSVYSIIRTKDTSLPEHAGNREYYDVEKDFFTDKDEAVKFVNGLNGVEPANEPKKGAKISTTIRIDTSEIDLAQAKVDKLTQSLKELSEITSNVNIGIVNIEMALGEFSKQFLEAFESARTPKYLKVGNYQIFDTYRIMNRPKLYGQYKKA